MRFSASAVSALVAVTAACGTSGPSDPVPNNGGGLNSYPQDQPGVSIPFLELVVYQHALFDGSTYAQPDYEHVARADEVWARECRISVSAVDRLGLVLYGEYKTAPNADWTPMALGQIFFSNDYDGTTAESNWRQLQDSRYDPPGVVRGVNAFYTYKIFQGYDPILGVTRTGLNYVVVDNDADIDNARADLTLAHELGHAMNLPQIEPPTGDIRACGNSNIPTNSRPLMWWQASTTCMGEDLTGYDAGAATIDANSECDMARAHGKFNYYFQNTTGAN